MTEPRGSAGPGDSDIGRGTLVISLDFELHWGVSDHTARAAFADRARGARKVVPQLLDRFVAHDVHATFATVGFLFARNRAEVLEASPTVRPRYAHESRSPYALLDDAGADESSEPDHFAPSLVVLVRDTPGQEIGSHTFSHCYCLEEGMSDAAFEADLLAARRIASRRGVQLDSLVFPRNQYAETHLRIARRCGFRVVRGNPAGRIYAPMAAASLTPFVRFLRLVDDYLPISGHNCHPPVSPPSDPRLPLNVPASRFLRPARRAFAWLEWLRFRRIARSMTRAARRGEIYHLWWHPHNFADDPVRNLAMLDRVLSHFDALEKSHGMRSRSLTELAEECDLAGRHRARPDTLERERLPVGWSDRARSIRIPQVTRIDRSRASPDGFSPNGDRIDTLRRDVASHRRLVAPDKTARR